MIKIDTLTIIFTITTIIGFLLIGLTLLTKQSYFLDIITVLTSMLIGFTGFLNYSSMSLNYPNRKLFILILTLITLFISPALNFLKIKNSKIKPIVIKISIIVTIGLTLLGIYLF